MLLGDGDYFVKAMVVDGNSRKVDSFLEYVFVADKRNIVKRDLIIADSLLKANNGYVLIRLKQIENGTKKIYTGMNLGWVEEINEINEDSIGNSVGLYNLCSEKRESRLDEILKNIEQKLDDKLNLEDKNNLMMVLSKYRNSFSTGPEDLGKCEIVKHSIKTNIDHPIAVKPRRIPLGLEEEVKHLIDGMLESNVISPSNSAWNFPIVLVRKKDGTTRMCVDYRKLNAATSRPIFPIPNSEEIFDAVQGARYFSTIDLANGYHQVDLEEEAKEKTAFSTRYGQFQFNRMPFGLCSAPATFQKLMNVVLKTENWTNCVIYLDDILIFGRTVKEHNERLERVLNRIDEAGLKMAPKKCFFLRKEIKYLGHVIDENGIRTDEDKLGVIKNWLKPQCVKELQEFLGLCGYYRRFIKDFAGITQPLYQLLKKDSKFEWNDLAAASFHKLKTSLMSPPVLSLPCKEGKYVLDTDASFGAIGAVLSQIQNGEERVIAYASRILTKAQRKYCITRKELLAIYVFVKKFKHYLYGKKFIVRTDHVALKWLLNWDSPNTSQYCIWKAELEIFEMEIEYRKGKEHINADAISRFPHCEQCSIKHQNPQKRRNIKVDYEKSDVSCNEEEKVLCRVEQEKFLYQNKDEELKMVINAILSGSVMDLSKIPRYKNMWKKKEYLRVRGDALYYKKNGIYRYIVPQCDIKTCVQMIHEKLGHVGIEKTTGVVENEFYWPGWRKDIHEYVLSCIECSSAKEIEGRNRAKLQSIITNKPFEIVGIDIAGPYPETKQGNRFILGIIDYFSKYVSLIPLKQITAENVAKALWKEWISKFGAPECIHSDNGTNFQSALISELCVSMEIKRTFSSPYYPQSNGLIERTFKTMKSMITASLKNHSCWDDVITHVEYGLRMSPHKSVKYSPFEVLFGRKPRLFINEARPYKKKTMEEFMSHHRKIFEEVQNYNSNQIAKQAEYYNRGKYSHELSVGDIVMVENPFYKPFGKRFVGPFKILEKINALTYKLYSQKLNKIIQRNYNQVKKIGSRDNISNDDGERDNDTSIESVNKRQSIINRNDDSKKEIL